MSESTGSSNSCPNCGAALPSTATAGLCPRCLMAEAMAPTQADTQPAAQPPLPPEQIAPHFPQLEILECLGRGGMGVVYKARQKTLNRFVALKFLAPERVNDPRFADRFAREAQALAALNHPNIVTIYDFGQAGGFYYLLMEFVDGANLRQLLRARKFTPEEALAIVPPLCDALQFAHNRGIVHRDIKPENLLLDVSGRVKVADFGIAKMLGTVSGSGQVGAPASPENATQAVVGTPGYSAPEQKTDSQRVDSRADIYSLGVVFYEMLTGELPGKRIEPPSKKVHIDVRLDAVVLRALEKTPELRWQTAEELRTQVETIATDFQPAASSTGMKRYENTQWNFSLDIPIGWNTFPPVPTNSPFEVVRIASHENGKHLIIIFRMPYSPQRNLKQMAGHAQQHLARNRFRNFKTFETTIGSRLAVVLEFDRAQDGGIWSCREYFIAEGSLAYTVGFGTSNKAGMFDLFDRMAKTFEFQAPEKINETGTVASGQKEPGPESCPPEVKFSTQKNANPKKFAIIVSACLLLIAGIAAILFYTANETIRIQGIPKDWSVLSGDTDQWNWTNNAFYGYSSTGDSLLASAGQYGDVTLSALVSTTNREASLAIRMRDADNGYVVTFGPDGTPTAAWNGGHIWLRERRSGEERQLGIFNLRGRSAPGKLEKLTFTAKGSWLEVRLNDVIIMRANDRTFSSGHIGLRVYGDPIYPCDGVFSNLTVRARWSELHGEAGAWQQEKAGDSQSVDSNAFANPELPQKTSLPSISMPSAGLVELKEKWPPGKRYVFDFNFKQDTAILLRGRTNTVNEGLTIGSRLGLTVLHETPDGGHELELEFLSVRNGIKIGDHTILDYDSANPSAADQTNGAAAVFREIVGSKIRYFLDANNNPERLEGVAELVQRIKSVPQVGPLTAGIKNLFNTAFFEAFTNKPPILPQQAVQPGDSWTSHHENRVVGTGIEVQDYTVIFQNWEMHENHRCARLDIQEIMKVKPDPNSKRDATTYRPRDGVSEGVVWFDPELGQAIEIDLKSDINVDKQPRNPGGTLNAAEQGQTITTRRPEVYTIKLEM
jgi:serine/threonine protein kinase